MKRETFLFEQDEIKSRINKNEFVLEIFTAIGELIQEMRINGKNTMLI